MLFILKILIWLVFDGVFMGLGGLYANILHSNDALCWNYLINQIIRIVRENRVLITGFEIQKNITIEP